MSSSKKKREADKQRLLRKGARRGRGGSSDVGFVKPDIHSEIRHITQLALAAESRIVTVGELVFFSTRTRDAWLLDAEDNYAICLCREGEPQQYRVMDTPGTFGIEWTASFAIEGAVFIVRERSGRVIKVHGYPTAEIVAACRR